MEIKGVKIGDKFIFIAKGNIKRNSEVIDIIENKSLATGLVVGHTCIAAYASLGQIVKFETAFATVVRNKIN